MKKYLMMGIAVLALASCSSHDDVYNPEANSQETQFNANFIKRYGKPAADQNWGFETVTRAPETRGVNANGNEWGLTVEVPQPLTEAQIAKVTRYFTETKNPAGIALNWSDFFVQQVSSTEWGQYMNYLYCGSTVDHTYNFNFGDAGVYSPVCYGLNEGATDQNDRKYGSDKIEFMVNSSTEYFAFHNSYDSQFYEDNYVIIPGEVIDAAIPGEPSVAGMWFVGFDYEYDKTKTSDTDYDVMARDWYFNDWIVKITPGIYKDAKRVICEDLGTTDDFDFNDVVFDAHFEWDCTVITLRAAGGTLPLTVGGVEVHQAFGVDQKTMVNTGIVSAPIAIYRVSNNYGYDINQIPVVVTATDAKNYTLKANVGEVPQKICVTPSYDWTSERQSIEDKYPLFKSWVGTTAINWYNN